MWFYGHGMGGAGWLLMWIIWAPLLVALVWMITRSLVHDPGTGTPQRAAATAREILDRRFASGEIGAETYREMRAALGADPQRGPGDNAAGGSGT